MFRPYRGDAIDGVKFGEPDNEALGPSRIYYTKILYLTFVCIQK